MHGRHCMQSLQLASVTYRFSPDNRQCRCPMASAFTNRDIVITSRANPTSLPIISCSTCSKNMSFISCSTCYMIQSTQSHNLGKTFFASVIRVSNLTSSARNGPTQVDIEHELISVRITDNESVMKHISSGTILVSFGNTFSSMHPIWPSL